jgi:23S rRNA pseudouridine1911/1915/1917 synthase
MLKSKLASVPATLHGERFDIAAAQLFSEISRKKIKQIIDNGGAYLNKKRIQIAKIPVKQNDKIEIFWDEAAPEKTEHHVHNKKSSLNTTLSMENVLFEHRDFFVINKPAGMASQSTLTSSKDTLFHFLNQLNPQKFVLSQMFLVHRLDKDTSGVMLIARNKKSQVLFEDLFREKEIKKEYDAFVFHVPSQPSGKIDFPIIKDHSKPNAYVALSKGKTHNKNAKEALTQYEVVKNFKGEVSWIKCLPKTGRTHQIRVHLAALGCPILGDKTYSQNIVGHRFGQLALRQMLHASQVEFEFGGEKFHFEAPFPEDFVRVKKNLEEF